MISATMWTRVAPLLSARTSHRDSVWYASVIGASFERALTMSKILSGIELEVIVSKLMAAKAEILHLIIEEENVSEAASDLWGVIEMLQEIILKIQSLLQTL